MDSDSDRTVDSDELADFIMQSQKKGVPSLSKSNSSKKAQTVSRLNEMSDSDSGHEVKKKKQKKVRVTNEDSNSDRTVDSDELKEFIAQSQEKEKSSTKLSVKKSRFKPTYAELSDSDSSDGVVVKKQKKTNKCISNDKREKCKYGKKCFRKDLDHIKTFDHGDIVESDGGKEARRSRTDVNANGSTSKRPRCQYGSNCYRKNETHRKEYDHGDDDLKNTAEEKPTPTKTQGSTPLGCKNYQFYLTKVNGIPQKYNCLAYDIKDILSFKDGTLISSAQFNYVFDIPWLMQQYPEKYRKCPLTIVHGEKRESKKSLERSGAEFSNIKFCKAKLAIPFGTHHTKMMFLLYNEGFRVVIHTSNIVDTDWSQRTQGMWVSPLLPELKSPSLTEGESATSFKADLLEYVAAYDAPELEEWSQVIKKHDFSKVKVFLIGSVPGRHLGSKKTSFGHLKLRKILNLHGSSRESVSFSWPVICQFSSIGSLGSSADEWMTSEFGTSLSTVRDAPLSCQSSTMKLVFPTVENVRKSLQGYPAGASLPYSIKVARKQPYLRGFMHQWKSDKLGRSEASPHIKTYLRMSTDNCNIAWFLLTSANLSKAAWGALEKNSIQFMIRSYELGVLFLPKFFELDMFSTPSSVKNDFSKMFPVPYDIPLEPYSKNDQPWIWDIPHTQAPDRYGQMWCPPPLV